MGSAREKTGQPAKDAPEKESLESLLGKLESVVQDLEQGETGLEQSLGLYEKGMALVNQCNQRLEAVEQRIALVTRGQGDVPQLEPFTHQASHEAGVSAPRAR
jgi:exodeoxyribonuclease VII small subunit